MENMIKEEALLVRVMDLFARKFDRKAVLRGGMGLRILGCERLTNDLDYVFIPFKSKKDIVEDVISTLKEIDGAEIDYSFNSKCLRVVLKAMDTSIQIEAKVAMGGVPVQIISNKELALKFNLQPRLIPVVEYSVALANKMAAWNERRLARDIYDIWFYLTIGIKPNIKTLNARLKKPVYSKLVSKAEYFSGSGVEEFYDFLRKKILDITDKEIEKSLGDYLKKEDIAGLAMKFRAALAMLK
jgi:predicted nucleotidyltransferase component of viral defense system